MGDGIGGGICCDDHSSPKITNNTFFKNSAEDAGGGIYCSDHSSPKIVNNTFSRNWVFGGMYHDQLYPGGAIFCGTYSSPTIINSILWGNEAALGPDEIYLGSTCTITITYSNIRGGWEGEGNIDVDPLFVGDGDLHLTEFSPCIEAGTSEGAPTTDIEGTMRGTPPDMGAYETSEETLVVEDELIAAQPEKYTLAQCVPNPFNPTTTIRYQLPEPGEVKLTIYDLLGQRVRVLVSERQPAGWYRARWDGRDEAGRLVSSGVYLYRLEVGGKFLRTKKMTVVR